MRGGDQRPYIILSILILVGTLFYIFYRRSECGKRQCPPGMYPYIGWYSEKCLCVVDPK